jgi:hypothetical protein
MNTINQSIFNYIYHHTLRARKNIKYIMETFICHCDKNKLCSHIDGSDCYLCSDKDKKFIYYYFEMNNKIRHIKEKQNENI